MIHGFLRLLRARPERHLEGAAPMERGPAATVDADAEPALAWEGL